MIKASVIIPTYERPLETQQCVELLLKSTGLGKEFDIEIIVLDDSSLANRKKTKEALAALKDKRVVYMQFTKHLLIGEKRERGIARAKNELIFLVDTDIEVEPKTLLNSIQFMKKNPTVTRATGTVYFKSGPQAGKVDRPTKWDRIFERSGVRYVEGVYGRFEILYRGAFRSLNGYDSIFGFRGEGTDLSVRCWRAGFPLAHMPAVRVHHNVYAGESASRTRPARMTEMYRSLFLIAFKYDITDPLVSQHFVESHAERQDAYGNATEFYAVVAAAQSMEWFVKNHKAVIASKARIPKKFDFKPFDIFTDKKLLVECLNQAKQRNEKYHKTAFGV